MKASVMDLRYRTREILRALEAKEEVILTHRGKAKGTIIPLAPASAAENQPLADHPAVGMWADHQEPVPDLISRIRRPRSC